MQQPSAETWCEEWCLTRVEQKYTDVYDGKIWHQFMNYDGAPFLSEPNNFALMLNMDFFQSYKHLKSYSVGVIYCMIINPPGAVRENVSLIGLIPGPKEPNSFLNPMVEELKKFWTGRRLLCGNRQQTKMFMCALLCVACDIPAGRKVCGFMGHTAHYACLRCFNGDFGDI